MHFDFIRGWGRVLAKLIEIMRSFMLRAKEKTLSMKQRTLIL